MAHIIHSVQPGSIAEQLGLRPGDALSAINGERVVDWVDYQALTSAEKLRLQIDRNGEPLELEFEKDDYEPLGLTFDSDMMGALRLCGNACVFCFVDQLPGCARESMRVKDDDWRTSLMMGSFVTLTNVSDRELDRIIARQASPLYISVHATDDALRCELLGTARGAGIMDVLTRLKDGGIRYHLQCVLCPGLNDGAALDQTIRDLASLHPAALSLALVPVGLTGHRDGLPALRGYDRETAAAALDQADRWRKQLKRQLGTRFVFPADEYYILANRPFPSDGAYEDYPQLDNGVGLCRLLETEFVDAHASADLARAVPSRPVIACGTSAARFLRRLIEEHPVPGVDALVCPVENAYFGPSVTVSGLLTGSDLVRGLRGVRADRVLITECMLRDGEHVFLDDMPLGAASAALGVPIVPVGRTGEALLEALAGTKLFDD